MVNAGKRHESVFNFFVAAAGCEAFADSSTVFILNKTNCQEYSDKCLGQKAIELVKTKCFILPSGILYMKNDAWNEMKGRNAHFDITSSMEKVYLKVNSLRSVPATTVIQQKFKFTY